MRGRHLLTIVGVLGAVAAPAVGVLGAVAVPAVGKGRPPGLRSPGRPSAGSVRVPAGFVGMMADGPIFSPTVNLAAQLGRMSSVGVERLRVSFYWNRAQPYRRWSDVPLALRGNFVTGPGRVPTDFSATDRLVEQAARHHLPLLPVVIYPPSWDASHRGYHVQPRHLAPYGNYLKALVHRYGRSGIFWSAHPGLHRQPITMWQIWNEPDLPYFWSTPKFAASYVALLRVAHRAIKGADPRARVVLASLTGASWRGLATIYRVHGARGLFDVVAENTYAPEPHGVINVLRHVRRVMDRNGDAHKPLVDTEVGWPSARGKSTLGLGVATNETGQASKLAELLPMLAAQRRALGLVGFYYYTWMSTDRDGSTSPFAFSGLLKYGTHSHRVSEKPAFVAFRQVALRLEGSRR